MTVAWQSLMPRCEKVLRVCVWLVEPKLRKFPRIVVLVQVQSTVPRLGDLVLSRDRGTKEKGKLVPHKLKENGCRRRKARDSNFQHAQPTKTRRTLCDKRLPQVGNVGFETSLDVGPTKSLVRTFMSDIHPYWSRAATASAASFPKVAAVSETMFQKVAQTEATPMKLRRTRKTEQQIEPAKAHSRNKIGGILTLTVDCDASIVGKPCGSVCVVGGCGAVRCGVCKCTCVKGGGGGEEEGEGGRRLKYACVNPDAHLPCI